MTALMTEAADRLSQPTPVGTCLHDAECNCGVEDLEYLRRELARDPTLIYGGEYHCPPLLHATIKEHTACMQILLDHGALVNEVYEPLGETPLSISVTRSLPEVTRLLLAVDSSGINVPSQFTHEPPLVRAVKHGNPEIVSCLLQFGARPDACVVRNEDELPVVFLAIEMCHQSMVKMLLDAGASLSAHQHFDKHNLLFRHIQFAIAEGQADSLKWMCLYGALHELNKLTIYPNLRLNVHYSFPLLCVFFKNTNPLEVNMRILDMLYEFGFNFWKCDKQDKSVWDKFEKLAGNDFSKLFKFKIKRIRSRPLNLKLLCRIQLQNFMGRKYVPSISKFEIPETLRSFLLFENL